MAPKDEYGLHRQTDEEYQEQLAHLSGPEHGPGDDDDQPTPEWIARLQHGDDDS